MRERQSTITQSGSSGSISNSHSTRPTAVASLPPDVDVVPMAKSNRLPARLAVNDAVANALVSNDNSSIPSAKISSSPRGPDTVTSGAYIHLAEDDESACDDGPDNRPGRVILSSVSVQWTRHARSKVSSDGNPRTTMPRLVVVAAVIALSAASGAAAVAQFARYLWASIPAWVT